MEFGVFDHLDRNDLPLKEFYEARLKLIEAYERAGFYAYHLAEHHSTPIGLAPSPSVFLSAVAQRTKRLRFGPLVYALPVHHPLRLIEEICMLDQLSGGRLEIGFGRGSSPVEIEFYGQDPAKAQAIYTEAAELILRGLTQKTLNYQGEHFSFKDIPMELEPLQKPHPPMWYGVHSVDAAERAAHQGLNMVSLDSAEDTRSFNDKYRAVWRAKHGDVQTPKLGLSRFIVIAENEAEARAVARRAYPVWHHHFYFLFSLRGGKPAHPRPAEFDQMMEIGQAVAGTPENVSAFLQSQLNVSAANYLVGQFAFGDLSLAESLRSVELFARLVMPALRAASRKPSDSDITPAKAPRR
ncbi:MAG: LLM class flavin-dependent oxidoreductase [Deltaproteobacteria bacterium]|nr:LLM class flavin-dependent oxidoreductase [Deltaproteobacteria bacterium]MDZ4342857.1 LLM class flavin-dependent oxidoreductase [Candidatus Binatia bacterium]